MRAAFGMATVGWIAFAACGKPTATSPDGAAPDDAALDATADSAADDAPDAAPFACSSPGEPDLGFGAGGWMRMSFGPKHVTTAESVVIDPATGDIVIGGSVRRESGDEFAVERLLPSGALDPSFGMGGAAILGLPGFDCFLYDIALQPDGKIVGVGGVNHEGARVGVIRLEADGTPDSTFGADGVVIAAPGVLTQGKSVAIDGAGRIVVAAYLFDGPEASDPSRFATLRFLPDGTPDVSFGDGGVATTEFGDGQDIAYDVVVQPDDKIITVGWLVLNARFGAVRYDVGGEPDPTFGLGGLATVALADGARSFDGVLDDAGRIFLVGHAGSGSAIARVTADGLVDPTYGQPGVFLAAPLDASNGALDADGNLIVLGTRGIARVLASGAPDATFAASGFAPTVSSDDLENDVAVQPDGRIVVVGTRVTGPSSHYMMDAIVGRYCP